MIENLRRNWWMILVSFVAFVFALTLPVFLIQQLPYVTNYALDDPADLATTAGLILGALFALAGFSWLHHPRKTRFYHSLPFTRTRHFMTRVAVMTGAFLVGLLFNYLIAVLRLYVAGLGSLIGAEAYLYLLLRPVLAYLVSVSLMLFCMQLTGRQWAAVLLFALFMVGLACIFLCASAICRFCFETYWETSLEQAGKLCCPPVWVYDLEEAPLAYTAASLLLSLGLTASAWLLYKKRPSEKAGKLLAFPAVWLPLKLFGVAVVSLGMGTLLMEFNESAGLLIFGVLAGCVLSHMGAEAAKNGQWKCVFRAWPCMLICLAVLMSLLTLGLTDALGYDTHVPQEDKVEQATLEICGENYTLATPQGTRAAYDLVCALKDEQPMATGANYIGEIRVDLKLKNGIHFRRTYAFDGVWTPKMESAARALVSQEEFRLATAPVPVEGEDRYIEVLSRSGDLYMALDLADTLRGEDMDQVLELYRQDCMTRTLEDFQGGVRYRLNIQGSELWRSYPVYAEDTKTVEFLSRREAIRQMEDHIGQEASKLVLYANDVEVARFTAPQEIRQIMLLAMSKDYSYESANFFDYREIYEVRLYQESEEDYYSYSFIRRDSLPGWADPGIDGPLQQRSAPLGLKEEVVVTRPIMVN